MRVAAIRIDYDGTIAVNDTMDPAVRTAIGEARCRYRDAFRECSAPDRAQPPKEFVRLIMTLPGSVVMRHLARHDFSRWVDSVFRGGVLAGRVRVLESDRDNEAVQDVVLNIDQTIRARYERISSDLAVHLATAG